MKPAIEELLWIAIELNCVACGEYGVVVRLDDTTLFHCNDCDKDFDADAVREHIEEWQAILAWCKSLHRDSSQRSRLRDRAQRN